MKKRCNALSLTGLLVLASAPSALALAGALPSGAEIVGGSVSIDYSGSAVDIHQQSARAAINWQSFNIGPNAAVNFHQPSRDAAALNRVTGADISQIQGRLSANGQVFLINPNGIVFTQTALYLPKRRMLMWAVWLPQRLISIPMRSCAVMHNIDWRVTARTR